MERNEKAINTLYTLLSNPPPDIDLTLVGGSALILWVIYYQELYPDNFDNNRIAGTNDIDFIALKNDVYQCQKYWGGQLIVADLDHATPEIAILCINPESKDESVQIDFLQDLIGIPRNKSLKGRQPISESNDASNIYLLSELMVLMNRIMNTLRLAKYQNDHAYDQIHNAMAVMKSAIMASLEINDGQAAARMAYRVLDLARIRNIGIALFVNFGIDLLDAVVMDDGRYAEGFTKTGKPALLNEIHERRESRIKHLLRRGKPRQEWWPMSIYLT